MELFSVLDYNSFQPVTTIIMWKGSSYAVRAQDTPLGRSTKIETFLKIFDF